MLSSLLSVSVLAFAGVAVAAPEASSKFKLYSLPSPLSGPCDLCTGPDKAIWVSNILSETIARVDPATGHIEEYKIPYTDKKAPLSTLPVAGNFTALACAIRTGTDGMLYAASGIRNELVQINPTTKKMKVIKPQPYHPLGNLENFNDLWTGPEGMFTSQTTANTVSYYHYRTKKFQNFKPPTPASFPLGMVLSNYDGALWFTELVGNNIARLNYTTGEIKEYPLPLPLQTPSVMRVEVGYYLWFVNIVGNSLGRIDQRTGEIKLYPTPKPLEVPGEIARDPKANIWFSAFASNTLNYYTPSTAKFTEITIPGGGAVNQRLPLYIPVPIHHYAKTNTMWFTKATTNQVGSYQL